jgi:hypothetical protein
MGAANLLLLVPFVPPPVPLGLFHWACPTGPVPLDLCHHVFGQAMRV